MENIFNEVIQTVYRDIKKKISTLIPALLESHFRSVELELLSEEDKEELYQ
jgi:hypothetical protein